MIKVVIIDDEENAVNTLELLLKHYCSNVEVVGKAHSALSGIKEIALKKPNLILLDVDMPGGSGFDMLESIPEKNFETIFITAYDHFAVKAFKSCAVDYLLKPVDVDELVLGISKAEKIIRMTTENDLQNPKYNKLFETIKPNVNKIAIPTGDGYEFVIADDIVQIVAEGRYSLVHFINRKKMIISKSLSEIEGTLHKDIFFRTHKSNIININHIKKYSRSDGGYLIMVDDSNVPISRRKRDEFVALIRHIDISS